MLPVVNLNLDVVSMAELLGAAQVWEDVCLVDPRAQIGGICFIVDLTSLRKEDMLRMFDTKSLRLSTKYLQVRISLHFASLASKGKSSPNHIVITPNFQLNIHLHICQLMH